MEPDGTIDSLLVFRASASRAEAEAARRLLRDNSSEHRPVEETVFVLVDLDWTAPPGDEPGPDSSPEAVALVLRTPTQWLLQAVGGDPRHHGRLAAELVRAATKEGASRLVSGPGADPDTAKVLARSPLAATRNGGWLTVDL